MTQYGGSVLPPSPNAGLRGNPIPEHIISDPRGTRWLLSWAYVHRGSCFSGDGLAEQSFPL